MIKLLQLNNLKRLIFFLFLFYFYSIYSFSADDIWKKKENGNEEENIEAEDEITIKSPILSDSITKIEISIDEEEIRQLARLGSQRGEIEADEAAMISKVFQLNDFVQNYYYLEKFVKDLILLLLL